MKIEWKVTIGKNKYKNTIISTDDSPSNKDIELIAKIVCDNMSLSLQKIINKKTSIDELMEKANKVYRDSFK